MKSKQMRELLDRWAESGKTLRAFGESEGVAYAKLLYWRRKFRAESEPTDSVDLAPVKIIPEDGARYADLPRTAPVIGVWLPNGVTLELPVGVAEQEVTRLVRALSAC